MFTKVKKIFIIVSNNKPMEGKNMDKVRDFLKANKFKVAVVLFALIVAIIACVIGEQFNVNNNGTKVSQTTEKYSVEKSEKLTADTVVQTGTVTVHYVDENGVQLEGHENTIKLGNVGDYYDIKRPDISMYVSAGEDPITKTGKYQVGNIDVFFKYKPAVKEVFQKVQKKGENGATENQINIAFNNTKQVRDYGLRIITKDENGNVINGGEFKIDKDNKTLREGKVSGGEFYVGKIQVSEEGKLLYGVEQTKSTIGYEKLEGVIDLGVNVTWNENDKKFEITVDESTDRNVSIKTQTNENGNVDVTDEIVIEVTNKKIANMYESEIINKSKTQLLNGGKFRVEKNEANLIEDYTKDGVLYLGNFKVAENGIDTYKIYELETAKGYEPVLKEGQPGIVEVTKTFNENTNKYDISVRYSYIEGFSAEIADNGKVTIYVVNKKLDKDYDLAIKKFVSKIDDTKTSNREPKVEIVEEKNGEKVTKKVNYNQNNDIEKAANQQKVTYTIRTYNESYNKGKGKRIIENIPDGLVYLPENETNKKYGWKTYKQDKDGDLIETDVSSEITVVATDYLLDKEIEGFNIEENETPKFEDVEVVLEIDESKITSKDRIIENTVEIDTTGKTTGDTDGNEVNDDNNKSTEKIYVKYFDLDVTKFIKEVTVKNNTKETKQDIGESQKGKLVKIDVAKRDVENTTIRVTYGLRVKNIGEIQGYATELMDYIPKDFVLVEDGIWNVKDDKAFTTKLENTLLKPGESTVIYITFDWKLTEDNIGRRINEGKITKYENEFNAKDPTEDNNDKEEMLVQIRTGGIWVFVVIAVLVGLWMIVGIVFILKKNK